MKKAGAKMKAQAKKIMGSKTLAALAVLGCGILLGGCTRSDKVVVEQPQAAAAPQPDAAPQPVADAAPQYAIVQQAPPPAIVEIQPPPPSAGSVWIDGYWNWDSQRYSWQAGRYAVPPQPDMVWVAPRYTADAHGNRYAQGQWSRRDKR
jgi:hypothetical protein